MAISGLLHLAPQSAICPYTRVKSLPFAERHSSDKKPQRTCRYGCCEEPNQAKRPFAILNLSQSIVFSRRRLSKSAYYATLLDLAGCWLDQKHQPSSLSIVCSDGHQDQHTKFLKDGTRLDATTYSHPEGTLRLKQ